MVFLFFPGCGEYSSLPDADRVEGSNSIPNNEYFYVRLEDARYRGPDFNLLDYVMYEREGGPGYDCKIPIDQDSTEDLYCMFDIPEGDLFYNSLTFEYNVPPGMCDYLFFETHWHYNKRTGRGPGKVYKIDCISRDGGDNIGADSVRATKSERYCLKNTGFHAGVSKYWGIVRFFM